MNKGASLRFFLITTTLASVFVVSVAYAQRSRPSTPRPAVQKPAERASKPELVIQNGHSDNVRAVAFSPDGKTLASASSDKTVRLWDVATGRMLRLFDSHQDNVTSIAFSPDGNRIASSSLDKLVIVSDVQSGRLIRTLQDHTDEVNSVAFSPDGKLIASGSRDETINIWDAGTGDVIFTLEGSDSDVRAVAFSPDGKTLASAGTDGVVRLWQVSDGTLLRDLGGTSAPVRTVSFSPDGRALASGSDDKQIRLWNVESGELIRSLKGHQGIITSSLFGKDGKVLVSGSHDKTVRIWDVEAAKTILTIDGADSPITCIALSPDESTVAAGSWNRIYLGEKGADEWIDSLKSRLSSVQSVAFTKDAQTVATASSSSVKIWDFAVGSLTNSLDGHLSRVNAIAFSSDGNLLASGSADRTIKVWDTTNNKPIRKLEGHAAHVSALAFSPDGKLIASGSMDKNLRLWNVETGKSVSVFEGHYSLVSAVAFAPDGRTIASGSYDHTIRIWELETGRSIQTLAAHDSEVTDVAFSPDGAVLASCSRDKTIKLWDLKSAELVRTLNVHGSDVLTIAFSPDGKLLASGGYDKTVLLSDLESGKAIASLQDHSGPILDVIFSSDGKFLASGSEDATTKIWSIRTAQPLSTLLSFTGAAEWLVITPDGLFDGSPEGWRSILWRFAGNTFDVASVEAFFNEFYHPGILADIMSGKAPKTLRILSQLDRRQPRLKLILSDNLEKGDSALNQRKVKVRIEVSEAPPDDRHPKGSGARDVRLFRNGSLIKVWRGDVLDSRDRIALEEAVSIIAGENHLTAYAFNRDNIKSEDANMLLKGSDRLKRKGTAYILSVGVNQYANPRYDLRYAVADAQAFSDTVKQSLGRLGIFAGVEIIPLFDHQATRANILGALRRLGGMQVESPQTLPPVLDAIKPVEPEDAVMVYFAGHGTAQQARFYLIPHDLGYDGSQNNLNETGLKTLLAHSISDRELEEAFEHIDAGGLLMVIDACNSGQALESEEKRRGPMNSKGLAQLAYEKGIYILTAAQGYQAALEAAELGHGFLTYALIVEGLIKGAAADADRENQVFVREWFDYAVDRVPQMQLETLQGERGLKIVFVPGEEKIADPVKRSIQRPRVFYRREVESQPLVIKKMDRTR